MNINRILSGEVNLNAGAPGAGNIDRRAFDVNNQPRFRNLTPHANVEQMRTLALGTIGTVTIPAMVHDNLEIYGYVNGNGDHAPAVAPLFSNLGLDPTTSQANRESLIIAQEWLPSARRE